MLNQAYPAATTLQTTASNATPSAPSRPSRLRGLSYLRSYTHNHLHHHSSNRSEIPTNASNTTTPSAATAGADRPSLTRSASSPNASPLQSPDRATVGIQSDDRGWLPTVQGRPGLSRESLPPTSTDSVPVSSERSMTRTRAVTTLDQSPGPSPSRRSSAGNLAPNMSESAGAASHSHSKEKAPTIKFIPHVEPRSTRPSLNFTASSHKLVNPGSVVRVGRYSERDASNQNSSTISVGFKSKVVSRRHCEFWCTNGQWYVKDVKSSSGTFLNHVRLSSPGAESRPFPVNDGDVVQLGIDFKGGEEIIFRCVKIRIECNRGWQKSLNNFNTTAHKRLMKNALGAKNRDSDVASVNSSECSICLNAVAPCQPLFVAPCSHVWHYKCIKNLLTGPSYPNFLCPNCRFVADLEADVEPPEDYEVEDSTSEHASSAVHENGGGSSTDENDRHDPESEHLAELLQGTNLDLSEVSPTSQPITIPNSSLLSPTNSATPMPRSTTPTLSPFELSHFGATASFPGHEPPPNVDGPMTPRNNAGPFVFDESPGRGSENSRQGLNLSNAAAEAAER